MRIRDVFSVDIGKAGGGLLTSPDANHAFQNTAEGLSKATFKDLIPGDVVFLPYNMPPTAAASGARDLRQVDGNMARCIYGFAKTKSLADVASHTPPESDFASEQGAVRCFEHPHSGYCDRASGAGFIYVAFIGPIDDKHGDDVTLQISP